MIPNKYKNFALTNNGLSARPCYIKNITDSLEEFLKDDYIFKKNIIEDYKTIFFNYLTNDKNNTLLGLKNYIYGTYTHGTIQAFEDFYSRHSEKRLRWFEGDFAYHKIASRSYSFSGEVINHLDDFRIGDAFVISVPFSASCSLYPNLEDILLECDIKNVPVLMDFAYLPISRNIVVDLNHESIDSICFSLSKCYFGIERLRTGLRLRRKHDDDPIDFFNEFSMFNYAGAHVAMKLIKRYPPSFIVDLLSPLYEDICKKNDLVMNNTLLFGSLKLTDSKYDYYKRGDSIYSRICLSEIIGESL